MVSKEGEEWWTDDDRETAAGVITVIQTTKPSAANYVYMGEFKTKNHSFRRYQEHNDDEWDDMEDEIDGMEVIDPKKQVEQHEGTQIDENLRDFSTGARRTRGRDYRQR
jgi:hypothetical protein